MGNYVCKYHCDWDIEIEEYLASGKFLKDFCEDKEYTLGAFTYHYYKAKKKETGSCDQDHNEPLPAFLPVEVVKEVPGDCDAVIRVNGFDLTINETTSIQALSTVLKAIGELTWK
jgi:hypothetical protein